MVNIIDIKRKALVVSTFPAIGKTYATKQLIRLGKHAMDSDSEWFHWLDEEKRIEDKSFPNNYVQYVKRRIYEYDIIFISSHTVVRDAFYKNNLLDYVVIPFCSDDRMNEYCERMKQRGDSEAFINEQRMNFKSRIKEIMNDTPPNKLIIMEDFEKEYLMDYINV